MSFFSAGRRASTTSSAVVGSREPDDVVAKDTMPRSTPISGFFPPARGTPFRSEGASLSSGIPGHSGLLENVFDLHREWIGVPEGVPLPLGLEPGNRLVFARSRASRMVGERFLRSCCWGWSDRWREPLVPARLPQGQEFGKPPQERSKNSGIEPSRLKIEGLDPAEPDALPHGGRGDLLSGNGNEMELEALNSFNIGYYTWSH